MAQTHKPTQKQCTFCTVHLLGKAPTNSSFILSVLLRNQQEDFYDDVDEFSSPPPPPGSVTLDMLKCNVLATQLQDSMC